MRPLTPILFVFFVLFCGHPSPAASPIPVGVAQADITPASPVHIINELEPRESEGVAQRLFAKALALGADPGPVVLLSFDGIGIPRAVADEVAARLEKSHGLPRERVAVCATHTHWSPHLTGLLPNIYNGPLPDDHQARVDAYTRTLVDQLASAATQALDTRILSQVSWTVGKVTFAANRRLVGEGRLTTDDALMFTWNPEGPVDHSLPVLAIRDLEGELRALHFTYACHNVALTGRDIANFENRIHGDWAGFAQSIIEQRHPGCRALVTIGCGGDARPSPVGGLAVAEAHAREIAGEIDRLLDQPDRWTALDGPIRCRLESARLPLEPTPDRKTLDEAVGRIGGKSRNANARGYVARSIINRLERGEAPPAAIPFSAQSWTFNDQLAMIFLAGEVTVDFQHRIRRELDRDPDRPRTWTVAYANATPCYIVSRRNLEAGGYEAGNSMFYYGWLPPLKPEAEDIVMQTVARALAPLKP